MGSSVLGDHSGTPVPSTLFLPWSEIFIRMIKAGPHMSRFQPGKRKKESAEKQFSYENETWKLLYHFYSGMCLYLAAREAGKYDSYLGN